MGQNDIKAIIIGLFEHQNELDINLNKLENLLRVDGYIYNNGNLYEVNTDVEEKIELIKIKYKYFNFDQEEQFYK